MVKTADREPNTALLKAVLSLDASDNGMTNTVLSICVKDSTERTADLLSQIITKTMAAAKK